MKIKDSGKRREFESGAVRDSHEANGEPKGRCDLMPLGVVKRMLHMDSIIGHLQSFQEHGNTWALYKALQEFADDRYDGSVETMLLEVAKQYEAGCEKYGENNWQKGIPSSCYIDSSLRHYLKDLRGDKDEPHHRAFVWNLMCCIWEVDYHG